jgi:hypothetical protein
LASTSADPPEAMSQLSGAPFWLQSGAAPVAMSQ